MSRFSPDAAPAFCIITPTAYLEYAKNSNTHLVLAHLVDKDPVYANFYLERSQAGDTVIMDNGAFELGESYEPTKLVELGKRIQAHALVLPDYPSQYFTKTIEAAEQYIPLFKQEGFSTFFVPQSDRGDITGWLTSYEWAAQNPDVDIIGMSILGIPNALPHIPPAYARVVMSQLLEFNNLTADKYHHFLGLNAAPNVEIPSLIEMGILNSCDSSNPVWCAVNGLVYNVTTTDWMPITKRFLREVDFNEPLSKKEHIHDAIQLNLALTLSMFQ